MNYTPNTRPIAIDLFAGCGGMTLGFEQAGFDVLASVELDPVHCATHEYNFPFWATICRSVTDISGAEIRELSNLNSQEIDVVFGGPPCQGFSLIGKRVLEDSRNILVAHFLRLVLELQPKYFVMENVPGMAVGKHKQLLEEIITQFEKNNYQVRNNVQILNAANYGVPQNRKRLFLLGSRQGLKLPEYPPPTTEPNPAKSAKIGLPKTPTVRDALQDLPEVNNYPELEARDWINIEYGKPSDYVRKLRQLDFLEDDYAYPRDYNPNLLTSSLRTQHTEQSIQRFRDTLGGKTEPVSRFYKLDFEGLCNTLRAGTPSNRGAYTSPRPIHPETPRCITVREAARLHSYPDWFRFHVTKWHGFRQVGNSVPPFLAKAVAQEIIKLLGLELQKPDLIIPFKNEELLTFNRSEAAAYYGVDPKCVGTRMRKGEL